MNYERGLLTFIAGIIIEAVAFLIVPNVDSIMVVLAILFLSGIIACCSDNKSKQ